MTAPLQPGSVRAGVLGTVVAHGGLIVIALLAARHVPSRTPVVYEVDLLAAPLPAPSVRDAPSQATPTSPDDLAPPLKAKPVKPKPVPRTTPPKATVHADKQPVTKAPAPPAPGTAPSTGQDAVTLRQDGIAFPYPEYLRNIENQIFRRWDHTMFRPGFDAKIAFVILKDGSVVASSIETAKSSGSLQFDLNARSAVESASNQNAFGPLPAGFNGASLPILFDFSQVPRGAP